MSLPNQLTTLRIVLTPLFVYLLFSPDVQIKYISLLIFLFATLTDWYDGYFARKYGYITLWGKFLDPLADKILVSSALFALYYLQMVELWMVIIIVVRDFLITGLRSYAMFRGQPVVTSQLAKIKTFAQMGIVYYVLIIYILQVSFAPSSLINKIISLLEQFYFSYLLMLIITLLTIYTAIQYFISNRKHLKNILLDIIYILRKKNTTL
jgi:CDP-diacylglycerol--glycerol-3-phosphate 3-phosphatidyltransferase